MKILVASDKFKGSLTAGEACQAIANGLDSDAHDIRQIPVADGGDGMSIALTEAAGGQWIKVEVQGPLGDPVLAGYGILDEGRTAAIEMAEASGLWLLGDQANDPGVASTFGTGQLIKDAASRGVQNILLGIGGSATNDGGTGMAEALGYQFFDNNNKLLSGMPTNLLKVGRIKGEKLDGVPGVTVACDVTNPLLGPTGCTRIYGPQKGILESDFSKHEKRLAHLVNLTNGDNFSKIPGAGAAGGLGFGALVFLNARLESGFHMMAKELDLESAIQWADLVVTGEGKIDGQSLMGKAPAGVAQMAKNHGKPVVAFCGLLDEDEIDDTFDKIWEIDRGSLDIREAMTQGSLLLQKTVEKVRSQIK